MTQVPVSPRPKLAFFWPLRLVAVLSLVGPALIFSYNTWQNRQAIDAQANERIERALDVLQEHALKALQTVERSISETNEVLRGLSDEAIRAREADLFLRIKRTQQALPQIEAIRVFDAAGHALVSSTTLPVVRDIDISDSVHFQAQKNADVGTHVSDVVSSDVGALWFFIVSGRRASEPVGQFNGIIGVTVMPEHFAEFYRKLTRGRDSFALVKTDGTYLARFPDLRLGESLPRSELAGVSRQTPEAGFYTAVSQLDALERRVGYRRVPGFDVYVEAGIETAALTDEFWRRFLTELAVGLPIVLLVFGLAVYALRRAERFQEETARREMAEAALKQAQRLEAIGQLTGGVAHDFNNLLMIVNGSAARLKRYATDERSRVALEAIQTAVKRGVSLTRQLLSFSRRQTHEAKVIDLKSRLAAIQEMLQSSLRGDITVETQIPHDVWHTKIDLSEFELALLNLAVNARDAMTSAGRLIIAARNVVLAKPNPLELDGEFVAVSVQDTGEGIAPDVLAHVFEPFFTTKEVGKGTGLGLSQVYGFARQAGGTATVSSELEKGTIVTLYLPRSTEPVEEDISAAPRGARASQRDVAVLLVEDNLDVVKVTQGFLEDLGCTVTTAHDAPTALSMLRARRERVDLVLTDIVMPGSFSGLDLARWIKQEYGNTLPVILASGYSENAQAAANEGFTILRKPYDIMDLQEALTNVMPARSETGRVVPLPHRAT
jgi:two-component system NtrC family sensor kinase